MFSYLAITLLFLVSTEDEASEFHSHLNAEAEHARPKFPGNPGLDVDESCRHQEDQKVEGVPHVTQSTIKPRDNSSNDNNNSNLQIKGTNTFIECYTPA